MPKIDLHCHLDGSLPLNTVRELTGKKEIQWCDLEAARDCDSLKTYLEKFNLPLEGMQTEQGLKRAARDFLLSLQEDHLAYVEVRFAPMLSVHPGLSCARVLESVLDGLKEGAADTGIFWNVIVCAMRHHSRDMNLEMLKTARGYLGEGVCAADLAGDEASYPAKEFRSLFAESSKLGIPFTMHAGECGSVENVQEAIAMGAGRIGHGIAMSRDENLMREAAQKQIGIELCPTSNFQTKAVAKKTDYPLKLFLEHGLLVTVNTDNRTVSQTTMGRELKLAEDLAGDRGLAEKLIKNALEAAFLSEEMRESVRKKLTNQSPNGRLKR